MSQFWPWTQNQRSLGLDKILEGLGLRIKSRSLGQQCLIYIPRSQCGSDTDVSLVAVSLTDVLFFSLFCSCSCYCEMFV